MKYLLLLKQKGEGCDYTIGCGMKFMTFNAASDGNALKRVKTVLDEHGAEMESVQLFKIDGCQIDVPFEDWQNEEAEEEEREEQERELREAEEKVARLRAKKASKTSDPVAWSNGVGLL